MACVVALALNHGRQIHFARSPRDWSGRGAQAAAALQAGMNVWNTQGDSAFQLPVRRHRLGHLDGYDNRNVVIFRNTTSGSRDRHHLLLVELQQPAARQRHHLLGRRLHVLHRHVGLRRGLQRRLHRGRRGARVRPRARPEPLELHRRDDVSQLQLLLAGVPHAGAGRHRRRPEPVSGLLERRSAVNTAPSVTISSPANSASFTEGTTVAFSGSATDTQDGNLTASIQWTDNGTSMGRADRSPAS